MQLSCIYNVVMDLLGNIILFTLVGSVVSLLGGVLLLTKEKVALKISHFLASFAAGVLLATAFFDLLPEALEHSQEKGGEVNIFLWTLIGILGFFLLERFIHWFHHHHDVVENKQDKKTIIPLIMLGDTVHNFIDGIVIAATFMANPGLGIVTALAVAAHEIPQEIGDFGVLLHRGMKRGKVLLVNFLSALVSIFGALITFYIGDSIEGLLPIMLSMAAGFFIYISLSDLIPEIHSEDNRKIATIETGLLILGVIVIWYALSALSNLNLPH
jgi:zinc and cadmium transporter